MNAERIDCGLRWPAPVCWMAEQASGYHWLALACAVVLFIMAR